MTSELAELLQVFMVFHLFWILLFYYKSSAHVNKRDILFHYFVHD